MLGNFRIPAHLALGKVIVPKLCAESTAANPKTCGHKGAAGHPPMAPSWLSQTDTAILDHTRSDESLTIMVFPDCYHFCPPLGTQDLTRARITLARRARKKRLAQKKGAMIGNAMIGYDWELLKAQ